jgi:hypothetical protein
MSIHDPSVELILKRLTKVEKQNRRMKCAGMALLALACCALLMGQTSSKRTVEAEKIILRDSQGHVRIQLEAGRKGPANPFQDKLVEVPAITLYGENLAPKMMLTVGQNGPELTITDEKGFTRTILGQSALEVRDREGHSAVLGSTLQGNAKAPQGRPPTAASLVLFGKKNKVIWSAP